MRYCLKYMFAAACLSLGLAACDSQLETFEMVEGHPKRLMFLQ